MGRVPASQPFDAMRERRKLLEVALAGRSLLETPRNGCMRVERLAQGGARHGELGFDGGAYRERGLLGEVGDRRAALELQLARVGSHRSAEDLHERRLPRSVDADEADALAFLDHQLQVAKDGATPEGEREGGGAEEGHAAFGTRPAPKRTPFASDPSIVTPAMRSRTGTMVTASAKG